MISPYVYVGMNNREIYTNPNKKAELIMYRVSRFFSLQSEDLLIKTRSQKNNILKGRQIAIYFIKEKTKLSLKDIGMLFGGQDHTTIIHSIRTVKNWMETDIEYRNLIDKIQNKIIYG